MSNHKKIDWLRWHKRKYFIRINCFIIVSILLIVLFLQFPIVHAESTLIKDHFFQKGMLNCEDGITYYGGDFQSTVLNDTNRTIFYSNQDSNYETYINYLDDIYNNNSVDISGFTNPNIIVLNGSSTQLYIIVFDSTDLYMTGGNNNFGINLSFPSGRRYTYNKSNGTFSSSYTSSPSLDGVTNLRIMACSCQIYYRYGNSSSGQSWQYSPYNYIYSSNNSGVGSGGFNASSIDSSIIDNDYIGENSFMYGDGVSINQWNLIIGLDLNEAQMSEINKYHYVLDCSLQAYYTLAKGISRNQETSLLQSYGLTWASNNRNVITMDFSKTYTDTLTTNYFTIPSTVFNDGLLCNGYTAVPLVNYISTYVPKGSTTNEIQSFFIAMSNVNVGPFSLPGYNETEWFNNCTISYNFSMNVYNENDDLITTLPLAMSYNPMTGQQSNYSNGGGKSQSEVQNAINQHNENKTPTDTDYKNPDDYKPSISKDNNDSSSNSNSNSSSSSNPISTSNASVTINQPSTYPTTPIMNKFISIIHNEKQGSVDKVESIIESNGYIELCNQALSAVPQPIWDAWTLAIKAILGILVSAFFLKILVNWST